MMDLSPYIGRGFSPEIDRIIPTVGVAGIDLKQVQSAVRLCEQTEAILYGEEFSPRTIRYVDGRSMLESIAKGFTGSPMERAAAAMRWTHDHIIHAHFAGPTPGDRAMTEEQLIESGRGYCNEQCRVFIGLCGVMEIPARLCFLWHANSRIGHTATELFFYDRWAFHDVTYQVRIQLPDQSFAEARQLRGDYRELAHYAYRDPLSLWYTDSTQLDPTRGGDLFDSIGICNYLVDGVKELR